jgi:hypothetical protein
MGKHRFRFTVLGRYPARLKGNATAVTVNMAAGEQAHLVHCGTLTMAEAEWDELIAALKQGLRGAVEVDDHSRG